MPPKIKAPEGNLSPEPDRFTQQAPDYTGDHADNRVLRIDLPWLKYGTDDKGHAAALILSALLLAAAILIACLGLFAAGARWVDTLVTWMGNAFLFTAGIAVGNSGRKKNSRRGKEPSP